MNIVVEQNENYLPAPSPHKQTETHGTGWLKSFESDTYNQ